MTDAFLTPVTDNDQQPISDRCTTSVSARNRVCVPNCEDDDPGLRAKPGLNLDPDTRLLSVAPRGRRMRVSIEGGIGVGKSTVLEALRKHFEHDGAVCFLSEPVDVWMESGMLARMYANTIDKALFQLVAATTRFGPLAALLNDPRKTVFVTERSLDSDKEVFARTNLDPTSEWPYYEIAAKTLRDAMPTDVKEVTVYLDASDKEVMSRIQARKRDEEQDIPMDYLARLREAHEVFYKSIEHDKVRIDASRTASAVAAEVATIIEFFRHNFVLPPSTFFIEPDTRTRTTEWLHGTPPECCNDD